MCRVFKCLQLISDQVKLPFLLVRIAKPSWTSLHISRQKCVTSCSRMESILSRFGYLSRANSLPETAFLHPLASLTEVFKAITQHGLWNYSHYSPLVRIAKAFGRDDREMEGWVQTYKQDLKAYNVVTTVEEYIETDLEIAGPPSAKRAKYDPRYYTPVEWKTKFVDHSLQYLAEVWELFSSHYLVPDSPPTALLDRVRRGCFSVTWLVPTGLIPQLVKRVQLDTEFFQKHRILKVTVGKECVYKEISEEITSVSFLEVYFENFVFAFKD